MEVGRKTDTLTAALCERCEGDFRTRRKEKALSTLGEAARWGKAVDWVEVWGNFIASPVAIILYRLGKGLKGVVAVVMWLGAWLLSREVFLHLEDGKLRLVSNKDKLARQVLKAMRTCASDACLLNTPVGANDLPRAVVHVSD